MNIDITLVTGIQCMLLIICVSVIDGSWCAYDHTPGWINSRLPTNLKKQTCHKDEKIEEEEKSDPQINCSAKIKIYDKEAYEPLRRALDSIRDSCGDLCDTQASSSYASSDCPKVRNQFFG